MMLMIVEGKVSHIFRNTVHKCIISLSFLFSNPEIFYCLRVIEIGDLDGTGKNECLGKQSTVTYEWMVSDDDDDEWYS